VEGKGSWQKNQNPAHNDEDSRAAESRSGFRQRMESEISESASMFRSIVENSHAGIFIIDGSFRLTYANNMLSQLLGRPIDDILGSDFRRFLDKPSQEMVAERYLRRQKGEVLPSRYEFNFIRRDGLLRNAELSTAVAKNPDGSIITVGQMLDITERKQAEAALLQARADLEMRVEERTSELQLSNELLRQNEIKFRHLVENANSIILEMDTGGNILYMNNFGVEFFGYKEDELLGRNVIGTIVPQIDSAGRDLQTMINEIVNSPEKYAGNENENFKKNGERVWVVWTNRPVYDQDHRLKEILCIGINYTEQKLAEEAYTRQLKERAASEERSRLARDLHDAVSQTLFSASIIADVLPTIWERNPVEGHKRLEEIRQLTRGALAEMRTLLLELRPASLVDADSGELLKQLAESITGRTRIPVAVTVEGACPPSAELKIGLYRIAQEALNNVAKHSQASSAEVSLHCSADAIKLVIKDNGLGFEPGIRLPGSLGIGIMQERANSIGADITIKSAPGQGTQVEIDWPKIQGRNSHGGSD
jgi:PAS domain S-box-containing protein